MLGLERTQSLPFSFKDILLFSCSAVSCRSQEFMETWAGWPLTPAQGTRQLSFYEQRDREATEPQTKPQQGNWRVLMALNLVARASPECHSRMLAQATSPLLAPVLHSQHVTANSAANRHPAGVQEDNSGLPLLSNKT